MWRHAEVCTGRRPRRCGWPVSSRSSRTRRCPWRRAGCGGCRSGCWRPRSSAARPPTASGSRARFDVSGLPSPSYCTHSYSAWAAPWAMPPCCWPSTSSGLRMRPQSSTAMWRSTDLAGLRVDLDDGDVGAERVRRVGAVEVELVAQRARLEPLGQQLGSLDAEASVGPRHDFAGTPATCRPPSPTTMSSAGGLQHVGGDLLGPVEHLVRGDVHRAPAVWSDREPIVPAPRGTGRCRS